MNLTKEQLAQNADAMNAALAGKPVQYRTRGTIQWFDTANALNDLLWNCDATEYRPKPQPVARQWNTPEDVPLHCWLRMYNNNTMHLVTQLSDDGTWGHVLGRLLWRDLHGYEYSTDRKTWHPCTVEDAQ